MSSQDDRVRELESKLEKALAAVRDLRDENDLLRARVVDRRPEATDTPARDPMPVGAVSTTIGRDSSEAEKITLFRSLFRGRDDVYAYRWESRDGRSGYAPALRPGAKREKGQRPDPSVLLPFDDSVAQSHLTGQKVIGVYPLLEDETCWLLAIDFDKSSWQEDVREVLATCDHLGAPIVLAGVVEQTRFPAQSRLKSSSPAWVLH